MTTPATPATPVTPPKESEGAKIKTFFEHIGDFLKEHLGSAASFEQTAATALSVVKPLLNSLLELVAGDAVEAKVSNAVGQAITDLNNTQALLNGAEAGAADHSLTGFLGSIQTNLSTLLADSDIKNSAKAAQITAIVSTVIGEVEAVSAAVPADHSVPLVGAPKPTAA